MDEEYKPIITDEERATGGPSGRRPAERSSGKSGGGCFAVWCPAGCWPFCV